MKISWSVIIGSKSQGSNIANGSPRAGVHLVVPAAVAIVICLVDLVHAFPPPAIESPGVSVKEVERMQPMVPDEHTALRIAEAVWEARFGKMIVDKFRPYHATLEGDRWVILGTPVDGASHGGGMPTIEISRQDGTVFKVYLGR